MSEEKAQRQQRDAALQAARDAVVEAAIEETAAENSWAKNEGNVYEWNAKTKARRQAVDALLALQAREEGANE